MKKRIFTPTKMDLMTETKEQVAVEVKVKTFQVEEQQTIVHCSLDAPYGMNYRIWKSTYLLTEKGHRCPLVAWRGICLAPQWMSIPSGVAEFTLIFTGLPSDCKLFSLIEDIPEANGFLVHDIPRNSSDVYRVKV
jgi:hypothetical protein